MPNKYLPVLFIVIIFGLAGCASLGYFKVPPSVTNTQKQGGTLLVNLSAVKDSMHVNGNGTKELAVTNYRKSLRALIKTNLGPVYDSIIFNTEDYQTFRRHILQNGTSLYIKDVNVKWSYSGPIHDYKDQKGQSSCRLQCHLEVFKGGKSNGSVSIDQNSSLSTITEKDRKKIFIDAQKQLAKSMYYWVTKK
jgi:hypothetical protein